MVAHLVARRFSGLTLGPVLSFPRTLAKQAKIISDFGGSVHQSIHEPNVYDLKLTFNSLRLWLFGSESHLYPALDLECIRL